MKEEVRSPCNTIIGEILRCKTYISKVVIYVYHWLCIDHKYFYITLDYVKDKYEEIRSQRNTTKCCGNSMIFN